MTNNTIEQWIEDHWDREAFLVVMRRIEILLMHNLQDNAVDALRQFVIWTRPEPPTLDASVHDVLPLRTANLLEEAGYDTLRAAYNARPVDILRIRNAGEKTIELIRRAYEAAERGERLPDSIRKPRYDRAYSSGELAAEFEIDWDYFAKFAAARSDKLETRTVGDEQQTRSVSEVPQGTTSTLPHFTMKATQTMSNIPSVSTETKSQLSMLLNSIEKPEETIALIDDQIGKREAELDKLKRLRKLLGGPRPTTRRIQRSPERESQFESMEAKIVQAVDAGPLRPKEIAAKIGENFAYIGRVVSSSSRLTKLADGRIAQVGS